MQHPVIVRANAPMTIEAIRKAAPSAFTDHAKDTVSKNYGFIPTERVLDGLHKAGFEVYAAGQSRARDKSNVPFKRHLLRLRQKGQKQLRKVGDEFPEIVLFNSHDGTSAFKLIGGIFRLVCSNGMVLGRDYEALTVRHSGNVVDNVIEGSFRVIEDTKAIADRVDQYSGIILSSKEQLALASSAGVARWGEHSLVTPETINAPRRPEDNSADLWSTFNRIQENITKGGQAGRSATGRRVKTRGINSIDSDTNLNRALFTLADEMAKLKA